MRGLGHEVLCQQIARAVEIALGLVQLSLALLEIGLRELDVGGGLFLGRGHVAAFEPREYFALLDPRAFTHAQPFEAPGGFRRDRGLALRDNVTRRVEQSERLRRISHRYAHGLDGLSLI